MAIQFNCECGQILTTEDHYAGRKTQCPVCARILLVPDQAPSGVVAPAPAPAPAPPKAPPTKPRICPKCKAPLPGDAALCVTCGSRVPKRRRAPDAGAESPRPLVPATSEEPESSGLSALSTLRFLAVAVIVVGLVAYGGCRFFVKVRAQSRAESLVQEALMERTKPHAQRSKGLDEMERAAAAEIAELLPTIPHFFGKLSAKHRRKETGSPSRIDAPLSAMIPQLPSDTDYLPLFELTDDLPSSRHAALEVVSSRADAEWIAEQSCHRNDGVRAFAAEALRQTFPYRELDDASIARLARSMSVERKQELYKELYSDVHDPLVKQMTGQFALQIELMWEGAGGPPTSGQEKFVLMDTYVRVRCKKREWTFTLFGKKASMHARELGELVLEQPVKEVADVFERLGPFHAGKLANGILSLHCPPPGKLELTVMRVPRYRVYREFRRSVVSPGYSKLDITLIKLEE